MFDYRYHAISLAAVLLALALGVLLGVAIGDSSFVSSAKNGLVHSLSSEVGEAHHEAAQLQSRLGDEEAFGNALYPLAVHELLAARAIGIVFLGSSSDQVDSLVRGAVAQAGGEVTTVVAMREPLELEALAHESADVNLATLAHSTPLVERLGDIVGRQLVSGGQAVDRELVSRVRPALMSAFDGQLQRLEGLVVMRAQPGGMNAAQSEAASAFESGLLAGVNAVGVPAVGVELSSTDPSEVPWYRSKGIASVDDLEQLSGQAALDYALAGDRGSYGRKSTAEALLPSAGTAAGQP